MNEISFKEFNKSILNNSQTNPADVHSTTRGKEVKILNESAAVAINNKSTTSLSGSKQLHTSNTNNTSTMSTANRSLMKQHANNSGEVAKVPFKPAGINSTRSFKKSVADGNLVPYEIEKDTLYSTWTPLSDETTNSRLFKERKQLFVNWFKTWNESQRRQAIAEMLHVCQPRQLFYARDELNRISPIYQIDFTRMLPRVICLYIFSFLDPRSLSRCAQVCWYWKMLTEADQLWMPKCLRFGWNLNYIPTSFESGIWKQFYIENIKALQYVPVKKLDTPADTQRSEVNLHELSYGRFGFNKFKSSLRNRPPRPSSGLKQPPWRANNSNPNHFYRFNYLDMDENEMKNEERLIKNLAIESAQLKRPRSSLRLSKSQSRPDMSTVGNSSSASNKQDYNSLNKSIENLITEGQSLLEEIRITAEKQPNSTKNLFDGEFKPPTENNSSFTRMTSKQQQQQQDPNESKQLWNMLDKSDTES